LPAPTPPDSTEAQRARGTEPLSKDAWRETMSRIPMPTRKACFKATYPKTEWEEVPCATPPNRPYPPARGRRQQTVGNGTDFSGEVTNFISSATGSFDSVTGVTSETGNVGGVPPAVANTYSLQLNTKPFTSSVCGPSPNPNCKGWQQFIYSNSGVAFIQYWLLQYNTACPAGWNTFSFPMSADIYCWENGPNAVGVPVQPIANLASLRVTGTANAGGTDTVIMTTAAGDLNAANQDSILNLAGGWQGAEFIIVGDCCGSDATFNAGSTLVVRTTVHHGNTTGPSCVLEGFTGETNNLTLVGTPAVAMGPSPAIVSTQSNVAGTPGSCAGAAGIGDTHLRTFGGLFYDFQATGDFVLAQASPDFVVQARQISGAPTWPDASVNKAVATQMGKTRVAICLPARLSINGKNARVNDGATLSLPDGVDVSRRGNTYLIADQSGDSVSAEVNATWINVSVGLGHWPAKVRGLLANANGNVNEIEARDGAVLTNPFTFEDLYHRYGDSWRVPPEESLLSVCGQKVQRSIPKRPFYANDLDPKLQQRTRAVCAAAGVKVDALLDACALDVAVIGRETAAKVFAGAPAPVAVAAPGLGR